MSNVEIFEQQLTKDSKLAIMVGGLDSSNPREVLYEATAKYCGNEKINLFTDIMIFF